MRERERVAAEAAERREVEKQRLQEAKAKVRCSFSLLLGEFVLPVGSRKLFRLWVCSVVPLRCCSVGWCC